MMRMTPLDADVDDNDIPNNDNLSDIPNVNTNKGTWSKIL